MKRLRFDALLVLASSLVILNQNTSSVAPWVVNDEQREVLAEVLEHQYTLVLKGRQVGISTCVLLVTMAFAIANPGINCAIVADTAEKAEGLLGRLKGWLRHLGVTPTIDNVTTITLPNGTTIDALSAMSRADEGESRVGRSKSYAFLHLSEVAFWGNDRAVFRSLTSTMLPDAKVVIESTASAADNLFKQLWTEKDNEWRHVFLPFERHVAYRRDPSTISDEKWLELQAKHGFTRRDAAAWWWGKIKTGFGGDVQGGLREYPVKAEDCFAFAEGRWILKHTPALVEAAGIWTNKRYEGWTYYAKGPPTEPVLVGVDTAAGTGHDSSAIAVIGELTGNLYATWMSSTTLIPDFLDIIEIAAEKWQPSAIIVESNGVGVGVYRTLEAQTPYVIIEQVSGAEKHQRLTRLKMAIESGQMPVGPEVVSEINTSRISKPVGPKGAPVYEGHDDLLNAISFPLQYRIDHMAKSEPVEPEAAVDRRDYFVSGAGGKRRRTY